jgi:hypothetical protein
MTTENLLILLFCTVDDWLQDHGVPWRPGPTPSCSDSEVITFMLARELLGYDAERRFRRVLLTDWRHLFPRIPAQSELNRRSRWLGAAAELLRQTWVADIAATTGDWVAIDTTPLPVKHPSRVRHADAWVGPEGLHAGYGRCAAKALWFYGFRLAVLTPLLTPVPLVWALVPAAVNERTVALEQLGGAARPPSARGQGLPRARRCRRAGRAAHHLAHTTHQGRATHHARGGAPLHRTATASRAASPVPRISFTSSSIAPIPSGASSPASLPNSRRSPSPIADIRLA